MKRPHIKPTSREHRHRELLKLLGPDEGLIVKTETEAVGARLAAKRINVKITTRKLDGVGFGVWRV